MEISNPKIKMDTRQRFFQYFLPLYHITLYSSLLFFLVYSTSPVYIEQYNNNNNNSRALPSSPFFFPSYSSTLHRLQSIITTVYYLTSPPIKSSITPFSNLKQLNKKQEYEDKPSSSSHFHLFNFLICIFRSRSTLKTQIINTSFTIHVSISKLEITS